MELVEVDAVQAQSLETAFQWRPQMAGAAVGAAPLVWPVAQQPALGADHETGRVRPQGLADQPLADLRTV
jgi:hypothetical protein